MGQWGEKGHIQSFFCFSLSIKIFIKLSHYSQHTPSLKFKEKFVASSFPHQSQSRYNLLNNHAVKFGAIQTLQYSGNNAYRNLTSNVSLKTFNYDFRMYSFMTNYSTESSHYFNLFRWGKMCRPLRDAKKVSHLKLWVTGLVRNLQHA